MSNQKKSHKLIKRIGLTILFGFTTLLAIVAFYVFLNLRTLPNVNSQYLNTYEPTKVVDSQNNVIWQPTDKRVGVMKTNEIPKLYQKSLIAVEDGDFWTNKGSSSKGVMNMVLSVLYSKVNPNAEVRGGSTLEQQLIKNVYFDGGNNIKTTTRKIQELYLARQLDHNFSKSQILTFYVNHLSFAEGDTGVSAMMMTYFGKKPSDYAQKNTENIAEQAYLAGLGQNPTSFNLYTNPKAANYRKNIVLSVMREKGYITKSEYADAQSFDLTTVLKPRYWEATAQRKQNLKYKGYTDQVLNSARKMGYNLDDVSLTLHTFLNQSTYDSITNTVQDGKYYQDSNSSNPAEQVGGTVIDKNGIVQGMVGSRFENDEVNRAVQKSRSSGSSMKPFTAYGPLIQYLGNKYNTGSVFDSGNYLYPGTNSYMHNWGNYTYGNVSAQYALRMSLNTVVGRIDDQILGSNRMKEFLHGVGLDNQASYSAVDGIGLYISSLDAAAAYNAINNGGMYTDPRFIDYIEFSDGSKKTIPAKTKRVMNQSTAWVLSQMLRGTIQPNFSAAGAVVSNKSYVGYAGKTGTVGLDASSQSPDVYGAGGSDSWFDSITNDGYSIALWFGYDEPNKSPQVSDSFDGPQYLGRDLQVQLNDSKSTINNWSQPSNVSNLGGSGINTNYGITDSKDITDNSDVSVPSLSSSYSSLKDVNNAIAKEKSEKNWQKKLSKSDKSFYNIFKSNNSVLDTNQVIDSNVFDTLQKGDK